VKRTSYEAPREAIVFQHLVTSEILTQHLFSNSLNLCSSLAVRTTDISSSKERVPTHCTYHEYCGRSCL